VVELVKGRLLPACDLAALINWDACDRQQQAYPRKQMLKQSLVDSTLLVLNSDSEIFSFGNFKFQGFQPVNSEFRVEAWHLRSLDYSR
jgi:hypothetical protein